MPKNIPVLVPQGDPERLRQQVTTRLNHLGQQIAQSSRRTENMDMQGNRVVGVADPGNATDAVNLRTLRKHIGDINFQQRRQNASGSGIFSIVFASIGTIIPGQFCAPYPIQPNHGRTLTLITVCCTGTGAGAATFNIAQNGANILTTPLTLPANSKGPVSVSISTPVKVGDLITPVIVSVGGQTYVSLAVEVQS